MSFGIYAKWMRILTEVKKLGITAGSLNREGDQRCYLIVSNLDIVDSRTGPTPESFDRRIMYK